MGQLLDSNVVRKPVKKRFLEKPVTEQEKVFCDCLIAGNTQHDALIKAGYFNVEDKYDPKTKKKMTAKARALKEKVGVTVYLQKNKEKIYLTEDLDTSRLKRHVYEIAMGTAIGTYFDKEGIGHEVPPSFGDQIAAANCYIKINEIDRKYALSGVKQISSDKVQINKVQSLLDKYKLDRPIAVDDQIDVKFEDVPKTPKEE